MLVSGALEESAFHLAKFVKTHLQDEMVAASVLLRQVIKSRMGERLFIYFLKNSAGCSGCHPPMGNTNLPSLMLGLTFVLSSTRLC